MMYHQQVPAFFLEACGRKCTFPNPAPGKGSFRLFALRTPSKTLTPAELPILRAPGQEDEKAYRSAGDELRPRWSPNYHPTSVMRSIGSPSLRLPIAATKWRSNSSYADSTTMKRFEAMQL